MLHQLLLDALARADLGLELRMPSQQAAVAQRQPNAALVDSGQARKERGDGAVTHAQLHQGLRFAIASQRRVGLHLQKVAAGRQRTVAGDRRGLQRRPLRLEARQAKAERDLRLINHPGAVDPHLQRPLAWVDQQPAIGAGGLCVVPDNLAQRHHRRLPKTLDGVQIDGDQAAVEAAVQAPVSPTRQRAVVGEFPVTGRPDGIDARVQLATAGVKQHQAVAGADGHAVRVQPDRGPARHRVQLRQHARTPLTIEQDDAFVLHHKCALRVGRNRHHVVVGRTRQRSVQQRFQAPRTLAPKPASERADPQSPGVVHVHRVDIAQRQSVAAKHLVGNPVDQLEQPAQGAQPHFVAAQDHDAAGRGQQGVAGIEGQGRGLGSGAIQTRVRGQPASAVGMIKHNVPHGGGQGCAAARGRAALLIDTESRLKARAGHQQITVSQRLDHVHRRTATHLHALHGLAQAAQPRQARGVGADPQIAQAVQQQVVDRAAHGPPGGFDQSAGNFRVLNEMLP